MTRIYTHEYFERQKRINSAKQKIYEAIESLDDELYTDEWIAVFNSMITRMLEIAMEDEDAE